jgi:hypothetical protein
MMLPRKIDEREEANALERASDGSRAAQHEEPVAGRVIGTSAGVLARHQEEQKDRAADGGPRVVGKEPGATDGSLRLHFSSFLVF